MSMKLMKKHMQVNFRLMYILIYWWVYCYHILTRSPEFDFLLTPQCVNSSSFKFELKYWALQFNIDIVEIIFEIFWQFQAWKLNHLRMCTHSCFNIINSLMAVLLQQRNPSHFLQMSDKLRWSCKNIIRFSVLYYCYYH